VGKSGGCFLIARIQRDYRGRGVLLFVCVRGGIILMVLDMQLFIGMDLGADCILRDRSTAYNWQCSSRDGKGAALVCDLTIGWCIIHGP
jgi:hypothetical protein